MALGAPWERTPDWWSLDDVPMRVRVPETTSLVRAVAAPERAAGLWTIIECTHPDDRHLIIEAIFTRPHLDVLDDAADVLVEKITGWKRWQAAHVWTSTLGAWSVIDGDLTAQGVDLTALHPARATNTAFSWWRRNLGRDEKAWSKWVRDMEQEPRRILEREADMPMDAAVFRMPPKR